MTIETWLREATRELTTNGITTARLDCLVVLEDETGNDRAWLLSHSEYELQGSEIENLSTKIAQRTKHVPLAYIRGTAEFYGRDFAVNAHTLVPRPETETIIELLKTLPSRHSELDSESRGESNGTLKQVQGDANASVQDDDKWTLVDIGTGSGAIAITAKLEFPEANVIATDIDSNCLDVAKQNAQNLDADITFLQGDLLQPLRTIPLSDYPTTLLCNLPYVPDNFQINTAATHEPRHALFGGEDGLNLYRKLFTEVSNLSRQPQYILTESLPPQHEALAAIAKAAGYSLAKTDDFIQLFTTERY